MFCRSIIIIIFISFLQFSGCYGHVLRADRDNFEKEVIVGCMAAERRLGQPWRRRIQDITDWSELGINEAAWLMQDRQEWIKYVYHVTNLRWKMAPDLTCLLRWVVIHFRLQLSVTLWRLSVTLWRLSVTHWHLSVIEWHKLQCHTRHHQLSVLSLSHCCCIRCKIL